MKVTQSKINELLSESGCEHNRNEEKRKTNLVPNKPQPSRLQGGCAFDGAMIALVPITDAALDMVGLLREILGMRGSLSSDQCFIRQVLLPTWAKMM